MSAAAQTKIFGVRLGVDPKVLVGGLIVLAGILFWYNSRGEDESTPVSTATRTTTAPTASVRGRTPIRRQQSSNDRGTLRLRPIDATRGDVDPTLRIDLLARLQSVQPLTGGRNLFEMGPPPLTPEQKAAIANAPRIVPKPLSTAPSVSTQVTPGAQTIDIPLKYYGFVKPGDKSESNRGFFLDGDNVLVASEGETVKQRYLVVELTPNSARLEDTQAKLGQTLTVVPAATTP